MVFQAFKFCTVTSRNLNSENFQRLESSNKFPEEKKPHESTYHYDEFKNELLSSMLLEIK